VVCPAANSLEAKGITGDGAQRAHPVEAARTPTHRLGPREIGQDLGQDAAQQLDRFGARLVDMGHIEIALLGVAFDLGLIERSQPCRTQEPVDGRLWRADLGALLFFAGIGRTGRQAGDGQRQAARRHECLGSLVDQTGIDQCVGYGFLEVFGRTALEAGGNFLGKEFKQEFGHGGYRSWKAWSA
jgi:hypothetical protein